ncbi:MAG: type phosphodiesterase/nucleotide pyrophosphatase [Nocardioides sp.]|nr:type phosphodiesterase/nucleotide pyrophosphatase [Nocardioides sp.]
MLRARSLATAALALALVVPVTACDGQAGGAPDEVALRGASTTPGATATPAPDPHVLAISVDGLNTEAITRLGATGAPTLHRLLAEGAGTLNARTEFEQTVTLPNHTSMMTSRRIDAARDGHGVTWDDDRHGTTVQRAAGHPVASIFSVVHAGDGSTALYSTKAKFGLYERSWPAGIDSYTVRENQKKLVALARADLLDGAPTFTFLHVSLPDRSGHEYGAMSSRYLAAVQKTDRQLGTLIRALAGGGVTVILTADHGFATGKTDHSARRDIENYRIPFVAWGAGVDPGDLYAMNPGFRDPGTKRPSYAGKQPVRNGDVANLAAMLLGLGAVPGSGIDADQSLVVSN